MQINRSGSLTNNTGPPYIHSSGYSFFCVFACVFLHFNTIFLFDLICSFLVVQAATGWGQRNVLFLSFGEQSLQFVSEGMNTKKRENNVARSYDKKPNGLGRARETERDAL